MPLFGLWCQLVYLVGRYNNVWLKYQLLVFVCQYSIANLLIIARNDGVPVRDTLDMEH